MDLSNVIARWVSQAPKDIGLIKDDRKLPPQAIWTQANCLATGLISLGLQPGEGVAAWLCSTPELVITYLAIQLAGGCFVPVFHSVKNKELISILNRSRSSIVIISLDLYDRYHDIEEKVKSVRQLVVDAGEIGAETTLPSNAKSLTPMLMVGRDVTLPDTEPSARSMCFFTDEYSKQVEIYREKDRWAKASIAAANAFKKNEIILNTLDLLNPEALLLGTIWPLLAYCTVFIQAAQSKNFPKILKENRFDTILLNADTAESLFAACPDTKVSKVLWHGPGIEDASKRIRNLTGTNPVPIKDVVDSVGFIP